MNGPHDVGGHHGLGAIPLEENEPVFHYAWEGRMYALAFVTAINGFHTIDEKRYAIEQLDPAFYLGSGYYERWMQGIENILYQKGILTQAEMEQRTQEIKAGTAAPLPPSPPERSAFAQKMLDLIKNGNSTKRELATPPQFKIGDTILTKNIHSRGHIRLPNYARDKVGVIAGYHGAFALPEKLAQGAGAADEAPTHLYLVQFTQEELWGEQAESPQDKLFLDLFECYIKPVS
ncbi:nitrile hydratase subunit beta [Leptolyngbya sp. NK1-12]|uniref:Nitrile hydratase subunit beta n=1 Tax=Leptolyngbya sp. NK1-12 TaxID=2547451 RepID=A0AA97AIR9_9CYAN|nr:nitrile hydratase subunit beta [Leptolyngbya sp. NK1-12]WNZ24136.1 nitrile hydratase subunit beta [Leptolyngbya sp. NK1-12]